MKRAPWSLTEWVILGAIVSIVALFVASVVISIYTFVSRGEWSLVQLMLMSAESLWSLVLCAMMRDSGKNLTDEVRRRKAAEREVENLTGQNERLRRENVDRGPITDDMVIELDRLRSLCRTYAEHADRPSVSIQRELDGLRAALATALSSWADVAILGMDKAEIGRMRALLDPPIVNCVACGKPTDPADRCPKCSSHVMRRYGMTGGGLGPYTLCANGDCTYFLKQGATTPDDDEPVKA